MRYQTNRTARIVADAFPASDVREILLEGDEEALPEVDGSAHVQVRLEDGTQREYSLINGDGDEGMYRIAVRRVHTGRGGSIAFHDALPVGAAVQVSAPVPGMRIHEAAREHVFVAGGIGVTAILGMLRRLPPATTGEIHYAVRGEMDAPYLSRLRESGLPVHVHDSRTGARLDVATLIASLSESTALYHCGPAGLMASIDEATRDWPEGFVRSESFGGAPVTDQNDEPFTAHLNLTGGTVEVGADESLLRAMMRKGVAVDYSCEKGECGTCILEYTAGDVIHRDTVLEDDERGELITPCISRAHGVLEIDA